MSILTDPVPPPLTGSPEVVNRFAKSYQQTADALRTAAKELLALANTNVSIGEAIDAVRDKAQEAHSGISNVATRYEGASGVYTAYHVALTDAQAKADHARSLIAGNNGNAAYWRTRKAELQLKVMATGGSDPDDVKDLKEAQQRVADFDADAASAMHLYNQAVDEKHSAVLAAIHGLSVAAHDSKLDDDFFEALLGAGQELYQLAQKYLAPVLKELRAVMELIKKIVDVLALIFTVLALFIPVLGPIALALTIASIALAALIFLCSLTLFALGKETLGRVVSDGISLAVSIVTSKLGGESTVGSLVGAGTKTAVKTVLTTVLADPLKSAAEQLPIDALSLGAEQGWQGTYDPFPSADGPAWGSNDTQSGNMTWHTNTQAENLSAAANFGIDEAKNVANIVLPGASIGFGIGDLVTTTNEAIVQPILTSSLTY